MPQPGDWAGILPALIPYLREQAQAAREAIPQSAQALVAARGGGRRDMSGNLQNLDPVKAQAEHNQMWDAMFTPTSGRIQKERERFQTPADIPTFTEQENAGINQRARNMQMLARPAGPAPAPAAAPAVSPPGPPMASSVTPVKNAVATPSIPPMGSPAPTPATARVAAPEMPTFTAPSAGGSITAPRLNLTPEVTTPPPPASPYPAYAGPAQAPTQKFVYGAGMQPVGMEMPTTPNLVQALSGFGLLSDYLRGPWQQMANAAPMIAPPQGYAPGAEFPRQQKPGVMPPMFAGY